MHVCVCFKGLGTYSNTDSRKLTLNISPNCLVACLETSWLLFWSSNVMDLSVSVLLSLLLSHSKSSCCPTGPCEICSRFDSMTFPKRAIILLHVPLKLKRLHKADWIKSRPKWRRERVNRWLRMAYMCTSSFVDKHGGDMFVYMYMLMWVCTTGMHKRGRKWEGNLITPFSIPAEWVSTEGC